jgi:hypothetical protein
MEGNIRQAFDCSDLFPEYAHAHCRVRSNTAYVQLWTEQWTEKGFTVSIEMNVDKISNFLEQCRKHQSHPRE